MTLSHTRAACGCLAPSAKLDLAIQINCAHGSVHGHEAWNRGDADQEPAWIAKYGGKSFACSLPNVCLGRFLRQQAC